METIYGESPEIYADDGYAANSGIALFSASSGSNEDGTITGGSDDNDGSQPTSSRIYWTITRETLPDGTVRYTGGITGVGWYNGKDDTAYNEYSPFVGYELEDIWNIASRDNNLSAIFREWNNKFHFGDISTFIGQIYENNPSCIDGYAG